MFKLTADFKPIDEQINATKTLVDGVKNNIKNQVLLGVTGSGKTYTMANVIARSNKPTLIISHNKTLAGQLYQEMRDFFPHNAVSYFVSYYDYYQPEAYIPQTDTYIEKEAQINQMIDKLRLAATSNILTHKNVVVVASVSCIYNIGSPVEYGRFILDLQTGAQIDRRSITTRLIELQYDRSEFDFKRGTFRVRGNVVDVYLAYEDIGVRVQIDHDKIASLTYFDPLTGRKIDRDASNRIIIYPAKHYITDPEQFETAEEQIRADLEREYKAHKRKGNLLEAQRLLKRVNYDLEMIKEMGYVNGIENYSRYFDGRKSGEPPYTLLDYFSNQFGTDWLTFVDESHMTVPQLNGMYAGDRSRKETLIEFGFRLGSSIDNRPLKFEEFYKNVPKIIYVSATPAKFEMEKSKGHIAQQLVRPTGIVDPKVTVRPADGEIDDVITEIKKRVAKKERVLVTALTKRIAEDLATFLKEQGIRAEYLHSDIKTLERGEILNNLRRGDFDVLIGINLLREGLDLPEVTLVAILDGDKEGFLRSKTALVQTMGRAARNIQGEIIIYADRVTDSIKGAITEVDRRRNYQLAYNKKRGITAKNIKKAIKERIMEFELPKEDWSQSNVQSHLDAIDTQSLTPMDRKKLMAELGRQMKLHAKDLNFEAAIAIRDKIAELESSSP